MVQIQIHQRQTNSWTLNITASTECFLVILVTSDGPSRKRSCPFLLPRVSRDSSLKKKTLTLAPSREQTGQCLVPWPSSGTWSFLSTWAFICSECYRLDKFCLPYARFPDLTIRTDRRYCTGSYLHLDPAHHTCARRPFPYVYIRRESSLALEI